MHHQDKPMGFARGSCLNELQSEEKGRLRRRLAEQAINLAMSNQWQQAIETNQRLIDETGPDVEAYNRLGKAYAQVGRIGQAREAYNASLKLEPTNTIALRNVARLAALKDEAPAVATGGEAGIHADPTFFIEETGKTVTRAIFSDAPKETLALVAAGDILAMRRESSVIIVTMRTGERLGVLDGKLSARLMELQDGGNAYAIAASGVDVGRRELRVLIREMRQSPHLAGRVSFPPETSGGVGTRAYVRGTMIRDERIEEDDDESGDGDEGAIGDEEDLSGEGLDFAEEMSES